MQNPLIIQKQVIGASLLANKICYAMLNPHCIFGATLIYNAHVKLFQDDDDDDSNE